MRIGFIQNFIDSANGKSTARRQRQQSEQNLANEIAKYKSEATAQLQTDFRIEMHKLHVAQKDVQDNIDNTKVLQEKIKNNTEALIACMANDVISLEAVLANPTDHYIYLDIVNSYPIHFLTALHIMREIDLTAAIVALLKYEMLDYQSLNYGIVPISALLNLPGPLCDAVRARMLNDILKAIAQNNFTLAKSLINYDIDYFRDVKINANDGSNILSYAIKLASNESDLPKISKFIAQLSNEYKFKLSNNADLAEHFNSLVAKLPHRPLAAFNKLESLDRLHIKDYAITISTPDDPLFGVTFTRHALIAQLKGLMKTKAKLSDKEIANFEYSREGDRINIKGMTINMPLAIFLNQHIMPHFKIVSYYESKFDFDAARWLFAQTRSFAHLTHFYIAHSNVTDQHIATLFHTLKLSSNIEHIQLYQNAALTPATFDNFTAILFCDLKFKYPPKCKINLDMIKGPINYNSLRNLYYHNARIDPFEICYVGIEIPRTFFKEFLPPLKVHKPLKGITLVYLHISAEMANDLLLIIKGSPCLSIIHIVECTLDEQAKVVLSALDLSTLVASTNPQLKNLTISCNGMKLISQAHSVVFPAPTVIVPTWQQERKNIFKENLAIKPGATSVAKYQQNVLSINLEQAEHNNIKNLFTLANNFPKLLTIGKIFFAKGMLLNDVNKLKNDFFAAYSKELKTMEVDSWTGSVAELNIIARLLSRKIHLHKDSICNKAVKVYGDEIWRKEIHIVRQGHEFYAYSTAIFDLIPNRGDNLNLFRACIQAKLDLKSHNSYLEIVPYIEDCAQQLQLDTFKAVPFAQNLCEADYKANLARYFEATSLVEMFLAIRGLPQTNLQIMQKVIALKNMLNAVRDIEAIAKACNISKDRESLKLMAILDSTFKVHQGNPHVYNLTIDFENPFDISEINIEKLKQKFKNAADTKHANLELIITGNKKLLKELENAVARLIASFDDGIKEINANAEKIFNNEMQKIADSYLALRQKQKDAFASAVFVGVFSAVAGGLLAPMLSTSLTTIGMGEMVASVVSQALISTTVHHLTSGDSLGNLPKNFAKNLIANAVATGACSQFLGKNVHELKNIAVNIDKARIITTTHKIVENLTNTALSGGNFAQNGLSTVVCSVIPLATNLVASPYVSIPEYVSSSATVALQAKFAGLENQQMLQNILQHVTESAAFTATSKLIAEPLKESVKLQEKTTAIASANQAIADPKNKPQAKPQDNSNHQDSVQTVAASGAPKPSNNKAIVAPKQEVSAKPSKSAATNTAKNQDTQKIVGALQTVSANDGTFNTGPAILDISNVNPNNNAPKDQAIVVNVRDNSAPERKFMQQHQVNHTPRIKNSSFFESVLDFVITSAHADELSSNLIDNYAKTKQQQSILLRPVFSNKSGCTLSIYNINDAYYPSDNFVPNSLLTNNREFTQSNGGAYHSAQAQHWLNSAHGLNDSMQNSGFVSLGSAELLPMYVSLINPDYGKISYSFSSDPQLVASNGGSQTISTIPIFNIRHPNALPVSDQSPWREREYNVMEKALIWWGGAIQEVASGGYQSYLMVKEELGFAPRGTAQQYTDTNWQDRDFYINHTALGQHPARKWNELGCYVSLGAAVSATGLGPVATGAVFGASMPTEEASWNSKLTNVAFGAAAPLAFSGAVYGVKLTHLMGTMGARQGIAAFTIAKSLNSVPKVNEFGNAAGGVIFSRGAKVIESGSRTVIKYAQGNKANLAYSGGKTTINLINPTEVRFSQSTVSRSKTRIDDVTGQKNTYTFDSIVKSMQTNGWQGEPINVVRMSDGGLTAIDNTRLLAARMAGIDAKIKIHDYNSPIPAELANNYYSAGKAIPKLWGEAVHSRISAQQQTYFQDRIFVEKFPNGSIYDPKLTGRGPE